MQELLLGFADYILSWPYWLWSSFNADEKPSLLGFTLLNLVIILLYIIHTKSISSSSKLHYRSRFNEVSYGSSIATENLYKFYNDYEFPQVISPNSTPDVVISGSKSVRRRKAPAQVVSMDHYDTEHDGRLAHVSISSMNPDSVDGTRHRYIPGTQIEKFNHSTVTNVIVSENQTGESENLGNAASPDPEHESPHRYDVSDSPIDQTQNNIYGNGWKTNNHVPAASAVAEQSNSDGTLQAADDQRFDEFIRKFKSGHFSSQLQEAADQNTDQQPQDSDVSPMRF